MGNAAMKYQRVTRPVLNIRTATTPTAGPAASVQASSSAWCWWCWSTGWPGGWG